MVEEHDDDAVAHRSATEADLARISGRRGDDDADSALADLRSELSIDEMRNRRRRREYSRHLATPPRVLCGSIGDRVTVWLSTGSSETGEVVSTGRDHACLDIGGDPRWITYTGIEAVASPLDPATALPRAVEGDATLIDVLEDLALSEVTVSVLLSSGSRISGIPLSAGEALTLRTDNGFVVVETTSIVVVSRLRGDVSGVRTAVRGI